jgi:hypothetical protein
MSAYQTKNRSSTRGGRRPAAAVLAAAAVLLILSWSCKSPTSADDGEADIVVLSRWLDPVDIYMDGALQFWLSYKCSAEIDNVSRQSHVMEARSQVTGEVVSRETLEVTARTDYSWTVERRARINCRNGFREPLKVFMDGVYQFDLAEREDRWILDVPLGEHFLAAYKTADGKPAASLTVRVTENDDYSWKIGMIEGNSPVLMAVD